MRLGRTSVAIAALSLAVSACTGSGVETVRDPLDPVVISDNNSSEEFVASETAAGDELADGTGTDDVTDETGDGADPARCLAIPQVNPIGGVDVLVTNVSDTAQDINIFRDSALVATVSPEPGGTDPKLSGENTRFEQTAFYTDFNSPLGATSRYTATTGDDPLNGAVCGIIDVPEVWPTPICSVEVIDGFPHLILEEGFGYSSYFRNGESFTIETPVGIGSSRLFDPAPPVGIPLRYTIISVNDRWPDTSSDCGAVTIDTAPVAEGLLEQAEKRLQRTLGPFWYTTIRPICADCEEDLEITYAFRFDGTVMGTWRNGFEADPSADPWRIPPLELATHLLAEREAGRSVEVDFVASTTTIARWTVDGIGAEVLCASVDTAPPTQRTPFCNPEFFN